jgi:hypothetical protein
MFLKEDPETIGGVSKIKRIAWKMREKKIA